MSDSRTSSLTTALSVAFDAGQLTSDGGLVWLAQIEDRFGLSAMLATQIRDWLREQALTLSLHLASSHPGSHPGEPLWHLLTARLNLRA